MAAFAFREGRESFEKAGVMICSLTGEITFENIRTI